MTDTKVDLHRLDDRERLQLLRWSKSLLIEYITTKNQSLQIDPVVVHLRIQARLQKQEDPEYDAIIATIGELKAQAKLGNLTSKLMYMMIKPYIQLPESPQLMVLVESFVQMLIVNNLFNKKVGPPATLLLAGRLHNENLCWPDYLTLVQSQNLAMANDHEHPQKAKIKWKAENHWATITMSLKLDVTSTNLWSEFVGFTHLMSMKLHDEILYAYNPRKLERWAEQECRQLDIRAKEMVNYHSFFYPAPDQWLNVHTPILNQTVTMAAATPPVVVDASTDENRDYRRPPQWAVFPQFHERINVEMKTRSHTHAFKVMF